jgi:hypothetical protein
MLECWNLKIWGCEALSEVEVSKCEDLGMRGCENVEI